MAFPTGAINDQVYTSKYGTRYKYVESSNTWVKYALPLYGSTGDQGFTGAPGLTGVQGATGVKGDTGQQGIQGDAGSTGGPGAQGTTGPAGTSPSGPQGLIGFYGSSTGVIGITFDGNESYLVPGLQASVKVPFAVTLSAWQVVTRETGYVASDIKSGSYSDWPGGLTTLNDGDTGPHVENGTKNSATGISGWSEVQVDAGNYLQFLLTGVTGVKSTTLSLDYYRT